ncbi:MAG: hypothetical protein HYY24_20950 [Verrucomicrobia bacterium]|nr:hypothetical protein [Verrucomicrobiota bacterium]
MNPTWPFKDLNAKARKGRYFPIAFSEAIRAIKRWGMVSDAGVRVRIHFENTTWEKTGDLLVVADKPGELLVIGSWPDAVSPAVARLAVARSFPMLAAQTRLTESGCKANPVTGWYLVRRSSVGELRLIERRLHFQQSRYRGGQKFSHAFKSRITRIDDHALPVPGHVEPDEELAPSETAA